MTTDSQRSVMAAMVPEGVNNSSNTVNHGVIMPCASSEPDIQELQDLPYLVDIPDEVPPYKGLPVLRNRLKPRSSNTSSGNAKTRPRVSFLVSRPTAMDLLNDMEEQVTAGAAESPPLLLGKSGSSSSSSFPLPPPLSPPCPPARRYREIKIKLKKRPSRLTTSTTTTDCDAAYRISPPILAMTEFLGDILLAEVSQHQQQQQHDSTHRSLGKDSLVVPASVYYPSVL